MELRELGRIDGSGHQPRICLGKASDKLASVCLTAPDKTGDVKDQSLQILNIIDQHFQSVGAPRRQILMVQVWLFDMAEYDAFCEVWNAWIDPDGVPALSVVTGHAARRDCAVEIRAYAAC